jgi:FkbM family methyltransferase
MRIPIPKPLRDAVKRMPVGGKMLYHAYLVAFHGEGRLETIRGGLIEGMRFRRFMHTYHETFVNGDYESEIQGLLPSLIRPGQTVYDVGANVGYLSMMFSRCVGPSGRVIAFEPGRRTARQLRAQLAANRIDNVAVEEVAISDTEGRQRFVTDCVSVMAKLESVAGPVRRGAADVVRTTTLDNVLERYPSPDLLKIDIEGAEIRALLGAGRLLREHRPAIIIELHAEDLSGAFHAMMGELNYDLTLPDGSPATPGDFSRFVIARPRPVAAATPAP